MIKVIFLIKEEVVPVNLINANAVKGNTDSYQILGEKVKKKRKS